MRNFAASVRPEEDGRRAGKEMHLLQEKWMILYGPPVEWLIIGKCNFPMASPVHPSVCWLVRRPVIIAYKSGKLHFHTSIGALVTSDYYGTKKY